jgi:hypothetical protein
MMGRGKEKDKRLRLRGGIGFGFFSETKVASSKVLKLYVAFYGAW